MSRVGGQWKSLSAPTAVVHSFWKWRKTTGAASPSLDISLGCIFDLFWLTFAQDTHTTCTPSQRN